MSHESEANQLLPLPAATLHILLALANEVYRITAFGFAPAAS
jgi:hypothetical protein